jgi:lipoyl(octanoyl) transferase
MPSSPQPPLPSTEAPPPAATVRAAGRAGAIDWLVSDAPVAYPAAVAFMEDRVEAIRAGRAPEAIWLLEHPALYTAGTSARPEELLDAAALPVFPSGRGGRYTYHGPGQRVAYVMLDLRRRGGDVRAFVHALEGWVIASLARLGVHGERRCDRIGIWVERGGGREAKIAAIGVRVRRWITFHGIAINVDPRLDHFAGIVPCGIAEHGVTSLADLGIDATLADVDAALRATVPARLVGAEADAAVSRGAAEIF